MKDLADGGELYGWKRGASCRCCLSALVPLLAPPCLALARENPGFACGKALVRPNGTAGAPLASKLTLVAGAFPARGLAQRSSEAPYAAFMGRPMPRNTRLKQAMVTARID